LRPPAARAPRPAAHDARVGSDRRGPRFAPRPRTRLQTLRRRGGREARAVASGSDFVKSPRAAKKYSAPSVTPLIFSAFFQGTRVAISRVWRRGRFLCAAGESFRGRIMGETFKPGAARALFFSTTAFAVSFAVWGLVS